MSLLSTLKDFVKRGVQRECKPEEEVESVLLCRLVKEPSQLGLFTVQIS